MACCSHYCVRQSLAVSGITQLDGGHWQGHSGPPGRTTTADLTVQPGHDSRAGNKLCVCVFWQWARSKVHRPLFHQTNRFFLHSKRLKPSRPLRQRCLTSVLLLWKPLSFTVIISCFNIAVVLIDLSETALLCMLVPLWKNLANQWLAPPWQCLHLWAQSQTN